jgi:hypothetical protein
MSDDLHRVDRADLRNRLDQIRPRRAILDALATARSRRYSSCLSDWECGFIRDVTTRYNTDAQLSDKQTAKALSILEKWRLAAADSEKNLIATI